MKHEMRLEPILFEEMKSGSKKVELRLNDEKRQKINLGDTIIFCKRPECVEKIEVRVAGLDKYKTIKELVEATPLEYWGPRFHGKQQLLNHSWHYSEEKIKKYGLLAIRIERI